MDEEDRARASRSLLSATTTVPDHLTAQFPIPSGCAISRTVHCDHALPHFQGRLPAGCFFEGKILECITDVVQSCLVSVVLTHTRLRLCAKQIHQLRASTSASYSTSVPPDQLDRTKTTIRMIAAQQRSELQAFFIVQSWLQKAMTERPSKKRRT